MAARGAACATDHQCADAVGQRGVPLRPADAGLAAVVDAARAAGGRRRLSDERHRHHDAVQALRPGGRRRGRPGVRTGVLA